MGFQPERIGHGQDGRATFWLRLCHAVLQCIAIDIFSYSIQLIGPNATLACLAGLRLGVSPNGSENSFCSGPKGVKKATVSAKYMHFLVK